MSQLAGIGVGVVMFLVLSLFAAPSGRAQSIEPEVIASRSSGVAPLAVFFDAKGTSCSDGCRAFHDLHYTWDFDDDANAVYATTRKSKNTASGPVAAHVFEKPGRYAVAVSIRSRTGQPERVTLDIAVDDPAVVYAGEKTICFSGSSNFAGCPPGARRASTASVGDIQRDCTSGKRCLLRRGETFSGVAPRPAPQDAALTLSGSDVTLGAFGPTTDPSPVLERTAREFGVGFGQSARGTRVMDIQVRGRDAATQHAFGSGHQQRDLLILRCSNVADGFTSRGISTPLSPLESRNQPLHDGLFFFENTFVDMGGNAIMAGGRRLAMVGNSIDSQLGAHGTRLVHLDRAVVAHNAIKNQKVATSTLTIRSSARPGAGAKPGCSWCGEPVNSVVVSDNLLRSTDDYNLELVAPNDSGVEIPTAEDFIVERNFFGKGDAADFGLQLAAIMTTVDGLTFRNNVMVMDAWQTHRGAESSGTRDEAYGNSCFSPSAGNVMVKCVQGFSAAYNNLLYAPSAAAADVVFDVGVQDGNLRATANPFRAARPAAPADFALGSSSVARDAGVLTPHNPVDFFGFTRVLTPRPDIGAVDASSAP